MFFFATNKVIKFLQRADIQRVKISRDKTKMIEELTRSIYGEKGEF